MSWYVVEAWFRSIVDGAGADYNPLVEKSWFLVSACDQEAAQLKAETIAQGMEQTYDNDQGERVRWIFAHIEKTREVFDAELKDGTEVWSEISREKPELSE